VGPPRSSDGTAVASSSATGISRKGVDDESEDEREGGVSHTDIEERRHHELQQPLGNWISVLTNECAACDCSLAVQPAWGLTRTGLAPHVAIGHFNTVTAWKPTCVNDTRTLTISGDTRHDMALQVTARRDSGRFTALAALQRVEVI